MNPPTAQPRSVLLIITGSIAAYKSLDLIRELKTQGVRVRCVLSKSAEQFVTPLSVAALSGEPVYSELFSLKDEAEMGHIRLSRESDLIVVAPASANFMARIAAGLADDLASSVILASDKPVWLAPAMNTMMWANPATQANYHTLAGRGVRFVGPAEGELACGETGQGRMVEASLIAAEIRRFFAASGQLAGFKAIVTAGPTQEAIDPVRYITNHSSGKQGYAIAAALAARGAEVTLISGPTQLPTPTGVKRIPVTTADEMLAASLTALPADIAVCAAAVADWKAAAKNPHKIKKRANNPNLSLTFEPTVDILHTLGHLPAARRPQVVAGFAAETESVALHAQEKLTRKRCDLMFANDVSGGQVFGDAFNTVQVVGSGGVEPLPTLPKEAVADAVCDRIATLLSAPKSSKKKEKAHA